MGSSSSDMLFALEHFTTEEFDRLIFKLETCFAERLQKIPDAPDPVELLFEALEDLLTDKRHCPLDRVHIETCLFTIVRSKVNHIYEKWKREQVVNVSDEPLEFLPAPTAQETEDPELCEQIFAIVEHDDFLSRIVKYQLNFLRESGKLAKARQLAEAFHVDVRSIYHANRRLKEHLSLLVTFRKAN